MINSIGIALGGLAAATKKVGESAFKIANLQTPGIGENVDLAEEAVNLQISKTAYKANIATIKASEEMSDELLHIFDERV